MKRVANLLENESSKSPDEPAMHVVSRLYEFDDYRAFLKAFFDEQKRNRAFFSHRYFARRAGLSSPSFCLDVIHGKYNLTISTIPKMIRGLGLKGRAVSFFEALVGYNQAKNRQERERCYEDLVRIREGSKNFRLSAEHHSYFSKYHLSVIRELAAFSDWEGDFKKLGAMLKPPISGSEAGAAVDTLVEIGLLERTESGSYRQTHAVLSTSEVPASVQRTARREILKLGIDAMDLVSPSVRHLSHATVSMSEASYEEASKILDEARRRIVELAVRDPKVERVYEVVLQAFPVSARFGRSAGRTQ